MPVPESYDEESLAEFMHATLGAIGTDLGFTPTGVGSYQEAVNTTLLTYGDVAIGDITAFSDIARLRAIAKVEAWRMAVIESAAYFDVSDGAQSLKLSQVHKQAKETLALVEQEASVHGALSTNRATIHRVSRPHDPYSHIEDSARTL